MSLASSCENRNNLPQRDQTGSNAALSPPVHGDLVRSTVANSTTVALSAISRARPDSVRTASDADASKLVAHHRATGVRQPTRTGQTGDSTPSSWRAGAQGRRDRRADHRPGLRPVHRRTRDHDQRATGRSPPVRSSATPRRPPPSWTRSGSCREADRTAPETSAPVSTLYRCGGRSSWISWGPCSDTR